MEKYLRIATVMTDHRISGIFRKCHTAVETEGDAFAPCSRSEKGQHGVFAESGDIFPVDNAGAAPWTIRLSIQRRTRQKRILAL